MDIFDFLKTFGSENSDLGYTGTFIGTGEEKKQRQAVMDRLSVLGIQIPDVSDQSKYHRELESAEGRLWTVKDGALTPYKLESVDKMHRDMDEGAVFVVRPSHRNTATQQERDTPEPLHFLFTARYNSEWALMDQDSIGLSAMATELQREVPGELKNSGGFLEALGDFFISILDKLFGGISTYRHDRTEEEKLNALKDLGMGLGDKVYEVGEDSRLTLVDLPKKVNTYETRPEDKDTVPERQKQLPLKTGELLDRGYQSKEKAFPGMEDLHEMYKELGDFQFGEEKGPAGMVTDLDLGYQDEIRGVVALLGGNSTDYAARGWKKDKLNSPDQVKGRLVEIILQPPEDFLNIDNLKYALKQEGDLNPLDTAAANAIMKFKGEDGETPYGNRIYYKMEEERERKGNQDEPDEPDEMVEKLVLRSISTLIYQHAGQPRLGERNIRLAQLAMQICHWAYAQNFPLNPDDKALEDLRGQLILADVTRKGLAAQEKVKNGNASDEELKDYYAMKVLEQSIFATHRETGGKTGRAQGVAEVIRALGGRKSGKIFLDNLYSGIQSKLGDAAERQKLVDLGKGSDKDRDKACLELYTEVTAKSSTPPENKKSKKIKFLGGVEQSGEELGFTERSRMVSTKVIEDRSAVMLNRWRMDVEQAIENTTDEKDKEGMENELSDLEKKLRHAMKRKGKSEKAHKEGYYVGYDQYSEKLTGADRPGKKGVRLRDKEEVDQSEKEGLDGFKTKKKTTSVKIL